MFISKTTANPNFFGHKNHHVCTPFLSCPLVETLGADVQVLLSLRQKRINIIIGDFRRRHVQQLETEKSVFWRWLIHHTQSQNTSDTFSKTHTMVVFFYDPHYHNHYI
jgi:hypothetical protein